MDIKDYKLRQFMEIRFPSDPSLFDKKGELIKKIQSEFLPHWAVRANTINYFSEDNKNFCF